jgi:hypothetical protein
MNFVMEIGCVFFETGTELADIAYVSFGLHRVKWLCLV